MKTITAFHVIAGLDPKSGGPSRTVPQLIDALSKFSNINAVLYSQKREGHDILLPNEAKSDCRIQATRSRVRLTLGLPLRDAFSAQPPGQDVAVLHTHGIWSLANHWALDWANRTGIPVVTNLRGMLEPWAINHKVWKKVLAMKLYQKRDIERAGVLIATSDFEFQSIRSMGFAQPVAVIPNGIDLNRFSGAGRPYSSETRERKVLFLSRIDPVKGLIDLVRAWRKVAPTGWCLQIAGPDSRGYLREVMREIRERPGTAKIEVLGELRGQPKLDALRSADLFVLPSYSENFGVAVLEAMATGVPVVTTRATPWRDLDERGCGWSVDVGVDALASALRKGMMLSDRERETMGHAGQAYAKMFQWSRIAEQTVGVYEWVTGQRAMPECVRQD